MVPLGGGGHGAVCRLNAQVQSGNDLLHVGIFQPFQPLGEACEQLGEDDPGIAPGAE